MFPKLLYPRIRHWVKQTEDFIFWLSDAQQRSPFVRFTIMSSYLRNGKLYSSSIVILIYTHLNSQIQWLQRLFLKAVEVMWTVSPHTHHILWRTRDWSSSNLCAPDKLYLIQLKMTWLNTVVISSYPFWYLRTRLPYMKKLQISHHLFNFLNEANHYDSRLCALPVPAFPAFFCQWERMCRLLLWKTTNPQNAAWGEVLLQEHHVPYRRFRAEGMASDTWDRRWGTCLRWGE